MTYDELSAFVASFTNRTDLTTTLPTFIEMTEEAASVLRVRQMVERGTGTLDQGETLIDAPDDFLAERSMLIGDWVVDYVSPETMDSFQWREVGPERPTHYTYIEGQFQFWPVADQSYEWTLTYYAKIPPLTDSAPNWLIEQFPQVYRFGCMVAASMKARDAEALALYQARFDAELAKITDRFRDKIGSPLKAGPMFMQGRRLFSHLTFTN